MNDASTFLRQARNRRRITLAACLVMVGLIFFRPISAAAGTSFASRFKTACQTLLDDRMDKRRGTAQLIEADSGWVYLPDEVIFAASGVFWGEEAAITNPRVKPEWTDPVPAIVDLDAQVRDRGVQLFVVPVPNRLFIYPEAVMGSGAPPTSKELSSLRGNHREFHRVLRSRGVSTVDLAPAFADNRSARQGPVFRPSDAHWTPFGAYVAAQEITRTISNKLNTQAPKARRFAARWDATLQLGMLFQRLQKSAGDREFLPDNLEYREVVIAGGTEAKLDLDTAQGPLLFLGDSTVTCWRNLSASLAHQLSYELDMMPLRLNVSGGGATRTRLNLARRIQQDPHFLEGKKVLVWCFGERILTSNKGWPIVDLGGERSQTQTDDAGKGPSAP